MKKILAFLLAFASLSAFACPDEIRLVQLDSSGVNSELRQLCPLNFATQPYLMVNDPITQQLVIANVAGMTWDGATLTATGAPPAPRVFSNATRALNTCFQLSATRDTHVTYPVDIGTTLSLTSGAQGTVTLKTFTNATCTAGAQEQTHFTNGQTGTLTLGLNLSQVVTGSLSATIPAGAWVELVTTTAMGAPTFTPGVGQEVLQ